MRFSGWKASFAGSFLARVCVFLCLPASGKKIRVAAFRVFPGKVNNCNNFDKDG